MKVIFSAAARFDLIEIGDYIAMDSPANATSFVKTLQEKALGLAHTPLKGTERNHLLSGLRLLPHRYYNIYYRANDDAITVVRIMHSARDIGPEDFT